MVVAAHARIGPNAVIQFDNAITALLDGATAQRVFAQAGLNHYIGAPPHEMIDEGEAVRLFRTVQATFDPSQARRLARSAGARTGNYILAHRIPKAAQTVLKLLPRPLAARALLSAIQKNAWTFCGSGRVETAYGRPMTIAIAANPLAVAGCHWHCAVFETLFGELISRRTTVHHVSCCEQGAEACRFEISI